MDAARKPHKRDRARTAVFARMRGRVSHATVIASVALFVALGGTAAAVTALPRDSVGSPQIRKTGKTNRCSGVRSSVAARAHFRHAYHSGPDDERVLLAATLA